MLISEVYTNETKGYLFGESGQYEPFTNDIGQLFRSCQREFGRCVSSVYQDFKDGTIKRIGWYFEKRMKYEDCNEYYVRGVWVTLYDKPDEHHVLSHYHNMN